MRWRDGIWRTIQKLCIYRIYGCPQINGYWSVTRFEVKTLAISYNIWTTCRPLYLVLTQSLIKPELCVALTTTSTCPRIYRENPLILRHRAQSCWSTASVNELVLFCYFCIWNPLFRLTSLHFLHILSLLWFSELKAVTSVFWLHSTGGWKRSVFSWVL